MALRLDGGQFKYRGRSGKRYRRRIRRLQWRADPRCRYCGHRFRCARRASIDHARPKTRGGDDAPVNLVICCGNCNRLKGNLTVLEWRNRLRLILTNIERLIAERPELAVKGIQPVSRDA